MIMCSQSVTYSILVNGEFANPRHSEGEFANPYFLIICAEGLCVLLQKA
jgi:hypothetical protein